MIELFHVSDLHFSKKKGVKEFLAKIKDTFKIEANSKKYLLITGDITDDGFVRQFKKAAEALAPMAGSVRAVPGNHDYGNMGFIYHEERAKYFDDVFLAGLGIRHSYFSKIPFHELLDDGNGSKVLLIGLNSCTETKGLLDIASGEIGEAQRLELGRIIQRPEYAGIPKIVFLHHIPHRRAKGIGMTLRDYKQLMAIVRGKVEVLAFGHQGDMEEATDKALKNLKLAKDVYEKISTIKKMNIPTREIKLRWGRSQNIKYYLDANSAIEDSSLYHIMVDGNKLSARLEKIAKDK
jgi:hypothetical protein